MIVLLDNGEHTMISAWIVGWIICFGLCVMVTALMNCREYPELVTELFNNGLTITIAGVILGIVI